MPSLSPKSEVDSEEIVPADNTQDNIHRSHNMAITKKVSAWISHTELFMVNYKLTLL